MRKYILLIGITLLPLFNFGALVLNCPGDTNVVYQTNCQFRLGNYTSRVQIISSDGTVFTNQFPAPGTMITGTTTIQITVTDTGGNVETCEFDLILPVQPTISLTSTKTLCFDEPSGTVSTIINGGTPPYSFSWSNGASTLDLNNVGTGTYTLTITDAVGCQATESETVENPIKLDITGHAVSYTGSSNISEEGAEDGKIITSTTGGKPPYFWQWTTEETTPTIDSLGIGTYKVVVTDMNGCVDTMAFKLIGPFSLTVPSGISPNGDGMNDVLVIKDLVKYPDNEIVIFNRWGDLVFRAKPYKNNWDGKNHSSNQFLSDELPDGIYFYHIKLFGAKQPTVKGTIVLKRK